MDGSVNPTSIAISISIGTALLAGIFSIWIAMRSARGEAVKHDTSVSILFGIALVLIVLNAIAAARIAIWGITYAGLLKAALLLTAAFAVAGMAFGLIRSLRSVKPIESRRMR
jgi:hypothetical protein